MAKSNDFVRPVPLSALLGAPAVDDRPTSTGEPEQPQVDPEAAGYARGLAEAEAASAARIAELEAALSEATAAQAAQQQAAREMAAEMARAIDEELARLLAALAHEAATVVLAHEPSLPEDSLRSLIGEALSGLDRGRLLVAEADREMAARLLPDGWQLVVSPGLPARTVEAQAGATVQRASLGGRLQQLLPEGSSA